VTRSRRISAAILRSRAALPHARDCGFLGRGTRSSPQW